MAYRFVTGVSTTQESLDDGDFLTVLSDGAITLGTAGAIGIVSFNSNVGTAVFGNVAAAEIGILLAGSQANVFVGQSGTVTGGKTGVWLGLAHTSNISVRNDGTIIGSREGVYLEGASLELVNTGTISVSVADPSAPMTAVKLTTRADSASYLTNTGTIIAGRTSSNHNAIIGGSGGDIVTNSGLIVGTIKLGAGHDRYFGQQGFCEGGFIHLGTGRNEAYGGTGAETFILDQQGDRLDDLVDGGAGVDSLNLSDGEFDVRVDLRVTVVQDTGVGVLTIRNVENLITSNGRDWVTGNSDNNQISTGSNNDTLEGGLGDDVLAGSAGNDTALFSGSVGATVNLTCTRPARPKRYQQSHCQTGAIQTCRCRDVRRTPATVSIC